MAYKKSAQKKKQVEIAESAKDKAVKSAVKKKVSKIAKEYKEDVVHDEDELSFFSGKQYAKILCIYFFKSAYHNLKSAFIYLFKYIKTSK